MQSYYTTHERVFQEALWLRNSNLFKKRPYYQYLLPQHFSALHQSYIIRAILVAIIV